MTVGASWKEVTLEDHVDLVVGYAFKSSGYTDDESDVRLLRGDNVAQGELRWDKAKRWPVADYQRYEAFHLREGDIILAMDRPWISAGLKYARVKRKDTPSLLVQRVARLRGTESLKTDYLRCVIGSADFTDYVLSILTGVNIPHISAKDIKRFRFLLPPVATQERISRVITSYDDLIENNTRRIEILEEMARRLYEEWFVQFRFPGHEGVEFKESELGLAPKGWSPATVKSLVVRLKGGKAYKSEELQGDGSIIVVDQSRAEYLGFHDNEPSYLASPKTPAIIFGDHTCKMQVMVTPFSVGPNTVVFAGQKGHSPYYIYSLVRGLVSTAEYKRHWSDLTGKIVLEAPATLSTSYGEMVSPMFGEIELLRRKNRNLRAQRDLLLPKLISGEIDVSDIPMPT